MKIKTVKTYTAKLTLGLNSGYSDKKYSIDDVKRILLEAQEISRDESDTVLSAKLMPCEIFFLGQDELSVEIQFIQYPLLPKKEELLREAIIKLAEYMMDKLNQNRTVIVFSDETVMLEQSDCIDPRIKLQ